MNYLLLVNYLVRGFGGRFIQGGTIEFSPPPLPSYEVEGAKILWPHPVGQDALRKYSLFVVYSQDIIVYSLYSIESVANKIHFELSSK